jgi:hypothetical protein
MEGSVGVGSGAGVKGTGFGTRTGAGCGGAAGGTVGGASGTTAGAGEAAVLFVDRVFAGVLGMIRVKMSMVILRSLAVFQS